MAKAVIKGKVDLDPRGANVALAKVRQGVTTFKNRIAGLAGGLAGAFAVGALVKFGRGITKLGSDISDMAFQTGLSTDEFQGLSLAARDAGTDNQKLTNTLIRLRDAQGAVITGDKILEDAFETLGISIDDVVALDMPGLFQAVAVGITEANNGAEQFAALADLIGAKNAPKLLEVFNRIANEGLAGITDEAKKLNQVLEGELIKELDALEDSFGRIALGAQIGAARGLNFLRTQIQGVAIALGSISAVGLEETIRQAQAGELFTALEAKDNQRISKVEIAEIQKDVRVAGLKKRLAEDAAKKLGKAETAGVNLSRTSDRLRQIGAGGGMFSKPIESELVKQTALAMQQNDTLDKVLEVNEQIASKTQGGLG